MATDDKLSEFLETVSFDEEISEDEFMDERILGPDDEDDDASGEDFTVLDMADIIDLPWREWLYRRDMRGRFSKKLDAPSSSSPDAPLRFNRIGPGWLATPDGKFAAVSANADSKTLDGPNDFVQRVEWAAVYDPKGRLRDEHNSGETLDWFDTAREAKEFLQREAQRRLAKQTQRFDVETSGDTTDDSPEDDFVREALVPISRVADLEKKVRAINRRAEKIGVPPLIFESTPGDQIEVVKEKREWDPVAGAWYTARPAVYEPGYNIKIIGPAPKVPGHTFIATVDHSYDGGNIIRRVPGQEDNGSVEKFREGSAKCDYCKKSRNRIDTYLVRNDNTGEVFQIGSNCLRDFLGLDPSRALAIASAIFSIDDMMDFEPDDDWDAGSFGPRSRHQISSTDFLAYVAQDIRLYGWTPRSAASEGQSPTADNALNAMFDRRNDKLVPTAEDHARAKEALDWIRNVDPGSNDYMHNLKIAGTSDYIGWKEIGVLASGITAYDRAMQREIEYRRQKKRSADSKHLGQVGGKISSRVIVTRKMERDSNYGVMTIVNMEDKSGNKLTWFASGYKDDLKIGDTYEMTGTVKKHDSYRGIASTVVTRAKMVKTDEPLDDAGDIEIIPPKEKPDPDVALRDAYKKFMDALLSSKPGGPQGPTPTHRKRYADRYRDLIDQNPAKAREFLVSLYDSRVDRLDAQIEKYRAFVAKIMADFQMPYERLEDATPEERAFIEKYLGANAPQVLPNLEQMVDTRLAAIKARDILVSNPDDVGYIPAKPPTEFKWPDPEDIYYR